MASSFRSLLEGLANSGQNVQLQKQIGQLVQSGAINKLQANNFFKEFVPIATKNQKPPEPLSSSELASLKTKLANQDGSPVRADILSRAVQTGQVSKEEANAFAKAAQENRAPRGPSRDPSTANKSFANLANRSIPAPRVTGPAFKVVNTPVTNPDAPTNNVTKPTGAATGPKPKNKKQAKISSDFDQIDNLDLTNEQKNDLKFSRAQADNNTFNRGDFKFLLDKLEGSKIRQNRDAQSQERQNIYSRGLASMFANF
jgi:polyhydroxyalkanoate synthesis regulator phasin